MCFSDGFLFCFFFFPTMLEHGLQTLAHQPSINNNNSSINNNNHGPNSGTNATKLTSTDGHQPLIASIHRNGKSSATAVANKAVAVPHIKSTPKLSFVNGELNDHLIEISMNGDATGHFAPVPSPRNDATARNSVQQKPTAAELNVIRANKSVVALSILIQHLTTDVSHFRICLLWNMNYSHWARDWIKHSDQYADEIDWYVCFGSGICIAFWPNR